MNADGVVLLERVLAGDEAVIKVIEKCATYARTKKDVEFIEYRKLLTSKDKVYAETAMVHLLTRLLHNLT